MAGPSTSPYRVGDLLALARQSWLAEMSARLASRGYRDYRRADAATIRILGRAPVPVGRLGAALGISRQAARKLVGSLEARGLASTAKDPGDARTLLVELTPSGRKYEAAIKAAIHELNAETVARTTPADLAAVDRVLRLLITGEQARRMADRIRPP